MVDLFFILSGFIISYTTESAGGRAMGPSGIHDFYINRVARIYPLHIFAYARFLFSQFAYRICVAGITRRVLQILTLRQYGRSLKKLFSNTSMDPRCTAMEYSELVDQC